MQYCSNNKQLGLVGANGYFINHDSQIFDSFTYPEHHKELWRGLIKKNTGFFPHSSAFFNKQLFLKAGGYRKSFKTAQDYDLWLRMGTICQIGCLQSPLAFIRKHNRQISFQRMGRQQLVDSFIALISYYLRQTKNQDPMMETGKTKKYICFYKWSKNKILKSELYNSHITIAQLKQTLSEKKNICSFFQKEPCNKILLFLTFIKFKIFGESIAKSICRQWVQKK